MPAALETKLRAADRMAVSATLQNCKAPARSTQTSISNYVPQGHAMMHDLTVHGAYRWFVLTLF